MGDFGGEIKRLRKCATEVVSILGVRTAAVDVMP